MLHLAAGQLLPVLVAVTHSPVAVSAVVHLILQSKTTAKVLPDGETYGKPGQGLAARDRRTGLDRDGDWVVRRLGYTDSRV